jgi:gamma-glutamyltranspeptidase/glutathione hydrolase
VTSAHFLATAIGNRILDEGGNAIDAGVATGIAINTTMPHFTNFGGVAPIIIYLADRDEVTTISGLGRWPRDHTLDEHTKRWGDRIPFGISPTMTPGAPDAWLTALELYGTMTLEDVLLPSVELAENGFPVAFSYSYMLEKAASQDFLRQWPANRDLLMPGGRVLNVGERMINADQARLFRNLIQVEQANRWKGRRAAIRAARDFFYHDEPAEKMVEFVQENGGILTMQDMRDFHVQVEPPEVGKYKDITLYTCGFWSQGPSLIQILKVLEGFDIAAMGHNSAQHLHTVLEAIKLGFSDRHYYYGDPEFADVPARGLLSDSYADVRRELIDPHKAWPEMPPPGDPRKIQGIAEHYTKLQPSRAEAQLTEGDTAFLSVMDRWGNVFGSTTSDTALWGPIVPGLGIVASPRGIMSWTDPSVPACIAPWKRSRITPNPAFAFRDGRFFLSMGTPGADVQVQAMVQMFLNIVEFGMNVQQAVEAPRVASYSHPDTVDPHAYQSGLVKVESPIGDETIHELERLGHRVDPWSEFALAAGCLCGIMPDWNEGFIWAGADPRRESHTIGR